MKYRITRFVDRLVPGQIVDGETVRPDVLQTYIKNGQAVVIIPPKPVNEIDSELEKLTVIELKDVAKELGISGYSTMVKAELVKAIAEAE